MSPKLSLEFTDFSMRLKDDINFHSGNCFSTALIICLLSHGLMKRSCACMEEYRRTCIVLTKLKQSKNQPTSQIAGWLLIYFGMILMKMQEIGKKMREVAVMCLAENNLMSF